MMKENDVTIDQDSEEIFKNSIDSEMAYSDKKLPRDLPLEEPSSDEGLPEEFPSKRKPSNDESPEDLPYEEDLPEYSERRNNIPVENVPGKDNQSANIQISSEEPVRDHDSPNQKFLAKE